MSYEKALEVAGATVHVFECFGSYQGDWYAKVTYKDKSGWVTGSYGSCSGCDSWEAEFGYGNEFEHTCQGAEYFEPLNYNGFEFREGCELCAAAKLKVAQFGEEYLSEILTQEEAEKKASKNLDWDGDAAAMLAFVKANS